MPVRRLLDFCCVLQLLSILAMLFVVVCLGVIESISADHFRTGERVLEQTGIYATVIFTASMVPLWLFACGRYWRTLEERSILRNSFYLLLLVGFSWLAGLAVYLRNRNRKQAASQVEIEDLVKRV
jgi:hypothetical protein